MESLHIFWYTGEIGKGLEIDKGGGRASDFCIEWDLQQPLHLSEIGAKLVVRTVSSGGIRKDLLQGKKVTVRSRVGGERCQFGGAKQRRTLKNILRERGVPPWERGQIPLVFVGNELVQVVGHFICAPYSADNQSDMGENRDLEGEGLLIESVPE